MAPKDKFPNFKALNDYVQTFHEQTGSKKMEPSVAFCRFTDGYMSQFQNVPFCPISMSGSNFYPRNA